MLWPHPFKTVKLRLYLSLSLALSTVSLGCHSANVTATISNHTAQPISLIQVAYPSASFGTQTLNPGQDFKYKFKVLGEGAMNISFTDSKNLERKSVGPALNEGSEGSLAIVITDSGVQWNSALVAK